MSTVAELRELEARHTMPTYLRAEVEFVRGEGSRLWDAEDNEYLDLFSGLSVHNAGHCHPKIVEAVRSQAGDFAGSSNLFYSEPCLRLAERLAESSLGGKVFLCNSGTEANECAIKLARKHAHADGIQRPEIVSLDGGFHGRTIGSLAATPRLADNATFGPLPEGFVAVPRDDAEALRAAIGPTTAAVMIEPVQGEAGIFPISADVLATAREACDETGALLIFDEVQSGMGRTGSLWAYEELGVTPDVMTSAKALGGGLPVGAVVTRPEFGDVLQPGDHGSTFAGGPLGARAALAALEILSDPELLAEVRRKSAVLEAGLRVLPNVVDVRVRGLMAGITLEEGLDAPAIRDRCLAEHRLVVNATGPGDLRLLPALTISEEQIEDGVARLDRALVA